jgi:uncharacterized protein YciI
MNYIVIARDHKDGLEKRKTHREAHLEGVKKMKEIGEIIFATALIEEEKMVGSVMVFDFSSEVELEEWKSREPYILGGVWDDIEIKQCAIPPLFM